MASAADNLVIDATFAGNQSRYINHSCQPNVLLDAVTLFGSDHTVVWLYSLCPIAARTQLTTRYGFSRDPNERLVPCDCGVPDCEGWL